MEPRTPPTTPPSAMEPPTSCRPPSAPRQSDHRRFPRPFLGCPQPPGASEAQTSSTWGSSSGPSPAPPGPAGCTLPLSMSIRYCRSTTSLSLLGASVTFPAHSRPLMLSSWSWSAETSLRGTAWLLATLWPAVLQTGHHPHHVDLGRERLRPAVGHPLVPCRAAPRALSPPGPRGSASLSAWRCPGYPGAPATINGSGRNRAGTRFCQRSSRKQGARRLQCSASASQLWSWLSAPPEPPPSSFP